MHLISYICIRICIVMQVLKTPLVKRKEAVADLITEMNPSKAIEKMLQTERFLNNELAVWVNAEAVLQHISEKDNCGVPCVIKTSR